MIPVSHLLYKQSSFSVSERHVQLLQYCWIRSVANGGIVITMVTIESWGGLV